MNITVTISDEEYAVLESWLGVGEVEKWVQHALDNKARQRMDASILELTNLNPKKMTFDAKIIALSGVTLPTRKMRDGEKDEK